MGTNFTEKFLNEHKVTCIDIGQIALCSYTDILRVNGQN